LGKIEILKAMLHCSLSVALHITIQDCIQNNKTIKSDYHAHTSKLNLVAVLKLNARGYTPYSNLTKWADFPGSFY